MLESEIITLKIKDIIFFIVHALPVIKILLDLFLQSRLTKAL